MEVIMEDIMDGDMVNMDMGGEVDVEIAITMVIIMGNLEIVVLKTANKINGNKIKNNPIVMIIIMVGVNKKHLMINKKIKRLIPIIKIIIGSLQNK
jgi:hypothetical protein